MTESLPISASFNVPASIIVGAGASQDALASGSPQNNPLLPSGAQIVELYQRAW